jgi:3'-5' exoribonuclease
MKEQYVRDLPEGGRVDSLFALRSRDIRSARTGEAYLALELGDCTGSMPAVMFRPSSSDEAVPVGSVVRVRGTVTTYRGVRRVSVESLRPETSYDREDLLATGVRERSELMSELRALVRRVGDRRLRHVLNEVFGTPGLVDRFASCPAECGRHHSYVGGLLEHTVAVATLCLSIAPSYPLLDRDLLVTAALLHDVGRVEELAYETSVGYTDAGRLVGHVVLGERLVSRAVERLGDEVPADLSLRLSHAILAHHGEAGSGAVPGPCSLEALVLRHADDLDARTAAFLEGVAGAAVLEERWTDGANGFARPLLVPSPPSRAGARAVGVPRCA